MWFPGIDTDNKPGWRKLEIKQQIFDPAVRDNLYSVNDGFAQGGVRHSFDDINCLVFPDGFRSHFDRDFSKGYYSTVAASGVDTMPPVGSVPQFMHEMATSGASSATNLNAQYFANTTYAFSNKQTESLDTVEELAVSRGHQMPKDQLHAWKVMGYPFNRQWKQVIGATTGHGVGFVQ